MTPRSDPAGVNPPLCAIPGYLLLHDDHGGTLQRLLREVVPLLLQKPLLHLLTHRPHEAALHVHAGGWEVATHRVDAEALVVAKNEPVAVRRHGERPATVERRLHEHALAAEGSAVEETCAVVLAGGENVGETRVEEHTGEVVFVAGERLDARARLVVPDLDRLGKRGKVRRRGRRCRSPDTACRCPGRTRGSSLPSGGRGE